MNKRKKIAAKIITIVFVGLNKNKAINIRQIEYIRGFICFHQLKLRCLQEEVVVVQEKEGASFMRKNM